MRKIICDVCGKEMHPNYYNEPDFEIKTVCGVHETLDVCYDCITKFNKEICLNFEPKRDLANMVRNVISGDGK